jgi:glycosyltransferase involved in cell wall biosynthesis
MSSFSIILPAYNEEPGIAAVLQSIRAAYPEAELIVVDDCSTDTTAAIAIQNGAKLIRHTLNLGAGKSVKDGVEQAFFDRIIMMDSDGTYPVDSIPALLAELDLGYNLVVGARHGYAYNGRILKRMARFVFRCLAEFATGKRIPDINSGMRAFRRSEILPYFPHLCNGFSLPTTMTLAYFFTGMKVRYVPIQYSKRFGHTKVKIIRDSLRTLQYMVESIAHYNPLKLFLLLASVAFVCGLISMQVVGIIGLFLGILSGLLIFSLGIAAESMRIR